MPSVSPGCWVYIDGFDECAGSYGIPVCRRLDRATLLLTAAHTVGSLSAGYERNNVVKFGVGGGAGSSMDEVLGHVVASAPQAPCTTLAVDAALIEPLPTINLRREIRHGHATLGSPRDLLSQHADDFIEVYKRGASSGLTSGLLEPEPGAQVLIDQTHGECVYTDVFSVHSEEGTPFAKPGDSGSIVIDAEDRLVGMVVGTLEKSPEAFCVPITSILDALEIDLIGPA